MNRRVLLMVGSCFLLVASAATVACSSSADPKSASGGTSGGTSGGASGTTSCAQFCDAELTSCNRDNSGYDDKAQCLERCPRWAVGTKGATAGNSLECRESQRKAGACISTGNGDQGSGVAPCVGAAQ